LRIPIVVASNNKHKIEEIKFILSNKFDLLSMEEIGFREEIVEDADTFIGNALIKARTIHAKYNCNCLADDSGLLIEALNNEPGVYSARYAGEPVNHQKNIAKVISKMDGIQNREAKFVTVIAFILNGKEYIFEGEVKGNITIEPRGKGGFGYDPIFEPLGYTRTFAELTESEKNNISHRGLALEKLARSLFAI
jgi:XTP/dITP diphosphohydrolase